ncbi:MAG: hypothetical protein LBR36_08945 [Bacteroidales bacterium]|jgi:hypothetical protein|nr:hypothetical protein [Bacteroidales bacterium]
MKTTTDMFGVKPYKSEKLAIKKRHLYNYCLLGIHTSDNMLSTAELLWRETSYLFSLATKKVELKFEDKIVLFSAMEHRIEMNKTPIICIKNQAENTQTQLVGVKSAIFPLKITQKSTQTLSLNFYEETDFQKNTEKFSQQTPSEDENDAQWNLLLNTLQENATPISIYCHYLLLISQHNYQNIKSMLLHFPSIPSFKYTLLNSKVLPQFENLISLFEQWSEDLE